MANSRGDALSGYIPAVSKGAKAYAGEIHKAVISGTVANSGVVYGFEHGLGKVPSFAMITPKGTVGQLKGVATSANSVGLATVSAMTSAKIFVAGAKNTHFDAFVIL